MQAWLNAQTTAEVFDVLNRLQHPQDCASARKLVCVLNKPCGFACQMHHVVHCLTHAVALNRTMVLKVGSSKAWDEMCLDMRPKVCLPTYQSACRVVASYIPSSRVLQSTTIGHAVQTGGVCAPCAAAAATAAASIRLLSCCCCRAAAADHPYTVCRLHGCGTSAIIWLAQPRIQQCTSHILAASGPVCCLLDCTRLSTSSVRGGFISQLSGCCCYCCCRCRCLAASADNRLEVLAWERRHGRVAAAHGPR